MRLRCQACRASTSRDVAQVPAAANPTITPTTPWTLGPFSAATLRKSASPAGRIPRIASADSSVAAGTGRLMRHLATCWAAAMRMARTGGRRIPAGAVAFRGCRADSSQEDGTIARREQPTVKTHRREP